MAEVKIRVNIDGQESIQTIDELNKSLDQFKKNTEGLEDGSKEVDEFNKSLEDLQKTLTDGLALDLDTEQLNSKLSEVSTDLTNLTGQNFNISLDIPEAKITTLAGLKQALREAKEEALKFDVGSAEFIAANERAGKLKNQIDDLNQSVKAVSGAPIANLASQFTGLSKSILTLDFQKATNQLNAFNKSVSSLDFASISKGASEFGKVLGGSLRTSFINLGKTILANPIFLITAVVTGTIITIVQLKDKFEVLQKAVDLVTIPLKKLIGLLKDLSDFVGLSNFEEQETLERTTEAYNKRTEDIEKNTNKELALARARGASVEELSEIEEKAAQARIGQAEAYIAENEKIFKSLKDRVAKGKPLTDAEKKEYEKLTKATEDLEAAQLSLQIVQLERSVRATEQLKKETEENEKNAKKQAEDRKKYLDELDELREKYSLTERQRIEKRFNDELRRIIGNSKAEIELRQAIGKARQKALDDLDARDANRAAELVELLKKNEIELQTFKAKEGERTSQQLAEIEKNRANALFLIEVERIERVQKEQIRLADGNKELILLAQKEANLAFIKAEQEREEIIKTTNDNLRVEREKRIKEETDLVISEIDRQSKELKDRRDRIFQNLEVGFGLLGNLDRLKEVFDEEKKLAEKQLNDLRAINDKILNDDNASDEDKEAARKRNIQLEQDYQKKLTQVNQEEAELREEILLNEINNRTAQVRQAIDIVATISSTQLDNERSRIEQSQTLLDADYEKRKQLIENNIQDEEQRKSALDALDKEVANNQLALDKQRIELQKKQIKRERNFALAQIALESAKGIATALAATNKTDPISFALSLAANIAAVIATISKARNALKEADASASALGAGGGGTVNLPSAPSGTGPGAQQFTPTGFQPTGVNPAQGPGTGSQNVPTQSQQYVSVIEIERVRKSVEVTETANTVFGGG